MQPLWVQSTSTPGGASPASWRNTDRSAGTGAEGHADAKQAGRELQRVSLDLLARDATEWHAMNPQVSAAHGRGRCRLIAALGFCDALPLLSCGSQIQRPMPAGDPSQAGIE